MDIFGLALQLSTVFLGAFLAFWLESLRERRQLKKRATTYLKQLRPQLIDLLNSQEAAPNDLKTTIKAYKKLYQASGEATFDNWDELT